MHSIFNTWIDNISSACWRFFNLPLSVSVGAVCFILLLIILIFNLFSKRKRNISNIIVGFFKYGLILIAIALIVDYKMSGLYKEVRELQKRTAVNQVIPGSVHNTDLESIFTDTKTRENLQAQFGRVDSMSLYRDSAMDIGSVRLYKPFVQIFVSVINLDNPKIEIIIDKTNDKTMTSKFAKKYQCKVAINGEAGISAHLNTGYGEYIGNIVINGETIMLLDSDIRPFLSFDKNNRAKYFPEKIVDVTYTPEKYNTIWGRFDILVDGKVVINNFLNNPSPRTAMAIDKERNRLFLLVADGRRPGYSMGLDRTEMAHVLKAIGAYDGMSVDPGGSSTMYCSMLGGIINFPSDNVERPTYTHFGIRYDS